MSNKCYRALSWYVFLSRTQTPMFLSAGRMIICLLFLRLVSAIWRCSGILVLGSILLLWRFVKREILCLWSIDSNGGYLVGGFQFGLGSLKVLEGEELKSLKKCMSQGSTKVLVFLKNGLVSRWGAGGYKLKS